MKRYFIITMLVIISFKVFSLEGISIETFGTSNGSDYTEVIQSAADSGQVVYFPPGKYKVSRSINFSTIGTSFVGPTTAIPENDYETWKGTAVIYIDSGNNSPLFRIQEEGITLRNLTLKGTGIDKTDEVIFAEKLSKNQDIDLYINNCLIKEATNGININGRGLYAENNNFVILRHGIKFRWEGLIEVKFDNNGNPVTNMSNSTGFRAITIRNNRFHAINKSSLICENNDKSITKFFTGLVFTGNFSDSYSQLFIGGLKDGLFSGNNYIGAKENLFFFDYVDNVNITANNFSGEEGSTDIGINKIQSIVHLTETDITDSKTNGLLFTSNTISNISSRVIVLSHKWENINISNNIIRINGDDYTKPIIAINRNGSNLITKNNIITYYDGTIIHNFLVGSEYRKTDAKFPNEVKSLIVENNITHQMTKANEFAEIIDVEFHYLDSNKQPHYMIQESSIDKINNKKYLNFNLKVYELDNTDQSGLTLKISNVNIRDGIYDIINIKNDTLLNNNQKIKSYRIIGDEIAFMDINNDFIPYTECKTFGELSGTLFIGEY